jgi:hypothetical protein
MDDLPGNGRDESIRILAADIKTDLDTEIGPMSWRQNRPEVQLARSANDVEAPDIRHYTFGVTRALSDEEWLRARELVTRRVVEAGFEQYRVVVDRASDHEVEFRALDGRELRFGTAAATNLLATGRPAVPEQVVDGRGTSGGAATW